MREIRIGCSGWSYAHWRGVVYPDGLPQRRWLEHYATLFDTVEVNATFYRLPRRSTVAAWVAGTPQGFVFAVKGSRFLTHVRRLTDTGRGLDRFYACLEPLVGTPKLGPVLWQLPETFRRDDDRLAAALAALPPGRHAFELRHESWFADEVYDLLRAHGATLVYGDHPARPFQAEELTADWAYVRFHHGRRGRRGNYSERELDEWADRLRAWSRQAEVYAYFNNDWEGFAVRNALGLAGRLGQQPPARR
ncbi:MAG TPA: DUF72 domain-containing protein [Gaiellaceae bacterium]|nr:DUF72 domain-containing protein [Gaiellaceae bacterium]